MLVILGSFLASARPQRHRAATSRSLEDAMLPPANSDEVARRDQQPIRGRGVARASRFHAGAVCAAQQLWCAYRCWEGLQLH